MKKNKLLLISLLFISIISTTYAVWQAGGGVKWIGEPETTSRFTGPTTIDGVSAYTDSWTGYKWETAHSPTTMAWSINNIYTEPTWNGSSYTYPVIRVDTDYPAFKYCDDKGAGWRLPTKKEMYSIMTKVEKNTSGQYTKLESITTNSYWSSTSNAVNTHYAWGGNFGAGFVNFTNKTDNRQVLCIHD